MSERENLAGELERRAKYIRDRLADHTAHGGLGRSYWFDQTDIALVANTCERAAAVLRSPQTPAEWELAEYEQRLRERGAPLQAAQLSLNERVREFVDTYARGHGSKAGRADYTRIVPLDVLEKLRNAFDEYARFRLAPIDSAVQSPRVDRTIDRMKFDERLADYLDASHDGLSDHMTAAYSALLTIVGLQ
jgi:hypothetical protein